MAKLGTGVKFRTTWLLLAAVLALAAYWLFVEVGVQKKPATEQKPAAQTLLSGQLEEMVRATVQDGDKRMEAFLADDGKTWMIQTDGYPQEADGDQVRRLIGTALRLEPVGHLQPEDVGSLAEYGLEPSSRLITLERANGGKLHVYFGDQNPPQTVYYARTDGDGQVFLIAKDAVETLLRLASEPPYRPTVTPIPTATES